ncbi:MAG: hypothetical protein PSV46_20155 [Reyranella sp.]|nr:hypothetical protein [Reyranella sp.]
MLDFLKLLVHVLASPFKTRAQLEAEIVVLRHQLSVLRRRAPPSRRFGTRLASVVFFVLA